MSYPPLKFPASAEDLRRAGYCDMERSTFCACGATLFWFLTPAATQWIRMEIDLDGRWTPHWPNCRVVKSEKKAELKKQAAKQGSLFR